MMMEQSLFLGRIENPIRKFFYLDTVAWNAYGPVSGKWNVNLVSTHWVLNISNNSTQSFSNHFGW